MKLKFLLLLTVVAAFLIAGCASKGYVDTKIAEMQTKVESDVNKTQAQTTLNADEIKKLQEATVELSKKTDMALNQAKGFESYQVIWEGVVNFGFDSFELNEVAKETLEGLGKKMVENPRSLLEVAGHTDTRGSDNYNILLGMKRAESVKLYLTDQYAVALYRMFTISYGKTKPVALPDERDANARNRRVVLKLWGELK